MSFVYSSISSVAALTWTLRIAGYTDLHQWTVRLYVRAVLLQESCSTVYPGNFDIGENILVADV